MNSTLPTQISFAQAGYDKGLLRRNRGPLRPLLRVSGCECEVQSHHALQIVGQHMPQQHGASLAQAAHIEALQAAVAQMRVDALDAGSSFLVDLLCLIGAHALAPLAQGLAVAGQQSMPIAPLSLGATTGWSLWVIQKIRQLNLWS